MAQNLKEKKALRFLFLRYDDLTSKVIVYLPRQRIFLCMEKKLFVHAFPFLIDVLDKILQVTGLHTYKFVIQ